MLHDNKIQDNITNTICVFLHSIKYGSSECLGKIKKIYAYIWASATIDSHRSNIRIVIRQAS